MILVRVKMSEMFIRPAITPKLIGGYFLEAAFTANGGCPSKNKDKLYGTEKRAVAAFQIFQWRNDSDDDRPYI